MGWDGDVFRLMLWKMRECVSVICGVSTVCSGGNEAGRDGKWG